MDFRRVSRIYREESRRKALTRMEPGFYGKFVAYLEDLEAKCAAETKKDFNSAKAVLLRDELRKVLRKREQIYAIRERKIAMLALAKVGGGPADTSVLTEEERNLYDGLVRILSESREAALGSPVAVEPVAREAKEAPPEEETEAPAAEAVAEGDENHVMIRLLEDVPPFAGLEGTYALHKSDVVSLPASIAAVLLKKGAAAEVRSSG